MVEKTRVVIDFETWSPVDLRQRGITHYAEDKGTWIRSIAFKPTGKPVYSHRHSEPINEKYFDFLIKGIENNTIVLVAHNYTFELNIWNTCLAKYLAHHGYTGVVKPVTIENFICTSALSRMCRGPSGLDIAAKFFNVGVRKDSGANNIMKKTATTMTQKQMEESETAKTNPPSIYLELPVGGYVLYDEEIERTIQKYCAQDVEVTDQLFQKLMPLAKEDSGEFWDDIKAGFFTDAYMNAQGIRFDTERVRLIYEANLNLMDAQADHAKVIGQEKFNSKSKIIKYWGEQGFEIDSLNEPGIRKAIEINEANPAAEKWLLEYNSLNKTSLKKMDALQHKMKDGILCDSLVWCGASATGRWSSRGVQLQNLPRPTSPHDKISLVDDNIKRLSGAGVSLGFDLAQSAIRSTIIPHKGDTGLVVIDFAQVEARHAMYVAGELQAMQDMADGVDLYKIMGGDIFKKPVVDIVKDSMERKVGKETILGSQYGMGAAKFKQTCYNKAKLSISDDIANKAIRGYRNRFAKIPLKWRMLQNVLLKHNKNLPFRVELATGRYLNYGILKKIHDTRVKGKVRYGLGYKTAGERGVYWNTLWGGGIFQHRIQAECRDLMLIKINVMRQMGHKLILTVHDEAVYSTSDPEKVVSDWNKAGQDKIDKYFPGLLLDFDIQYLNRYWK